MPDHTPQDQAVNWEERSLTTPGGRLRLEPVTREHAAEMAMVLEDPSLNELINGQPPTAEYLANRYEALSARRSPTGDELWLNWIVRLNAEGLAVGYVQATARQNSAALAWVIGVPWQGAGIATEAATAMTGILRAELGITTFSASIAPTNHASQKVASKLSMSKSGMMNDGEEVWILSVKTPEASASQVSSDGNRAR
ncbi:MAG: GNAT family N-acetyltransferase [Actinomycetota bacterium]|nr:GNAT family N-acetyltransferase [Actinomycetota bacterium]